jgi:hypothetical protein
MATVQRALLEQRVYPRPSTSRSAEALRRPILNRGFPTVRTAMNQLKVLPVDQDASTRGGDCEASSTQTEPPAAPDSCAHARDIFATTHWSVVLTAAQSDTTKAQAALATLCQTYWRPLYIYARHRGRPAADAEDLVQGFFARFLEKNRP